MIGWTIGLAQAKRHSRTLAVLFLDLGRFQEDQTIRRVTMPVTAFLKTVAGRLANNTRSDDTMSRHGGDEFLCVLTEVSDEHAVALIAAKLINVILAPCHIRVHDLTISLSVKASIGISLDRRSGRGPARWRAGCPCPYPPFRLRARVGFAIAPSPAPATSNRTCRFPASGSPRRRHPSGL